MSLDQTQVDTYVTAASDDDPELKLKNLEQEVDLIKTSIKRLLLDLRERISEFQNPSSQSTALSFSAVSEAAAKEAEQAALEARAAALDARESNIEASETAAEESRKNEIPADKAGPAAFRAPENFPPRSGEQIPDPAPGSRFFPPPLPGQSIPTEPEKLNLQKVYRLYSWTDKAVKKFGQDRLEIMLESYRVMGYMPTKSKEEILGIARLMPVELGAAHELCADEFVSELYTLRRILVPDDTSLDRDMIAVLMEQRRKAAFKDALPKSEEPLMERTPVPDNNPVLPGMGFGSDWMDLHS